MTSLPAVNSQFNTIAHGIPRSRMRKVRGLVEGSPKFVGRLELTWTNKHLRLLAHEDGTYEWVRPGDYRVSEVRLLHNVGSLGVSAATDRARDNLLIRGDALSALTSLTELPEFSRVYAGKVKLAYLDPPFNTKQSFLQYDDALEHSVWLTMLRDRVLQVQKLLAPDGTVWVHLDDSEVARCKVMMDELFPAGCFVASVIWRSADSSNNDAKQFSVDHNTLLVYSAAPGWRSNLLDRTEETDAHYSNPDDDPRGPWFPGNVSSPKPRENLRYEVVSPTGKRMPPPANGWRWQRETMNEMIEVGEITFSADGSRLIRKTYLADQKGLPPSTLWDDIEETGHNRQAKYELKKLFKRPAAELFATPKPERLMRKIVLVATRPGDIVLDPFVGSGTTAAVAHKMSRRWVGIEWSAANVEEWAKPRLQMVVEGKDHGGITDHEGWKGGGGFRVLDVAPSMFADAGGVVVLAPWATQGQLAEATAAQLGYTFEIDGPFCGRKGRTRLAVVDGLVNADVARLLVAAAESDARVVICGTAVDPVAREVAKELRPGSTVRKIPASILDDYRENISWPRQLRLAEHESEASSAGVEV